MHQLVKRVSGLMRLGRTKPLWFDTVQTNPPLSFKNHPTKSSSPNSRIKPPKLVYPEDKLRTRFYRDHPFELDSPLSLGKEQSTSFDLESAVISPEWAIQRQLQLMEGGMKESQAYQKACEEFEQRKAEIEVAERLARQEQLQVQKENLKPLSQLLDSVFLEEKREIEYKRNMKNEK
jgi:hypothetical protein